MRAFYALFVARNKEFLRDRSTLAWNFLFPFVAIGAMALIFSGDGRELYKVGVLGLPTLARAAEDGVVGAGRNSSGPGPSETVRAFLRTRYIQFVPVEELASGQDRVRRHQFDLLLDAQGPGRYWVNPTNPKGYFLERALWAAGNSTHLERGELEGLEIRYIDWLLPGVLAMNMMFTCLWGVGYVIVRYRKGLILRRFKATPVRAVQFISAQILSRLVLVLFVTVVLFFGLDLVLGFYNAGSLLALLLVAALGSICMIALSIAVSARTTNLELAGGLLNLVTWPMMFLSGVWFSLEGSAPWLIWLSKAFPLTHLIDAARKIMMDGATLAGVLPELGWLTAMTAVFLASGAALFRWE